MSEWAVQTTGLAKRYGQRAALDGVDLRIPAGALTAFLGPNGAGKTTTLRMLLGLVRPSAGTGTVLDEDLRRPARYLHKVGALIESPAFYPTLSGTRNLVVQARLAGIGVSRIPAVLERVGLAQRGGDPYRSYSLGMKQRLGIAAALLGDPALLILDEPTNGLDPAGIHSMRELLLDLAADGPAIILSSHLLCEVSQLADWLIVLDRGRAVFTGTASSLIDTCHLTVRCADPADSEDLLALAGSGAVHAERTISVPADSAGDCDVKAAAINRAASRAGIVLVEISRQSRTLESRYLELLSEGAS